MEGEIADLKSTIRILVLSCPTIVTLRKLSYEYQDKIGAPIPYEKYGYETLASFIRATCGDMFLFTGSPTNPILTLVVPSRLKKIDELVTRNQIVNVKKQKRISVDASKLMKFCISNNGSVTFEKESDEVRDEQDPDGTKMYALKIQICDLLKNHADGIDYYDFQKIFKNTYERPIPYAIFGFTDALSLLYAMEDIVIVEHIVQARGGTTWCIRMKSPKFDTPAECSKSSAEPIDHDELLPGYIYMLCVLIVLIIIICQDCLDERNIQV